MVAKRMSIGGLGVSLGTIGRPSFGAFAPFDVNGRRGRAVLDRCIGRATREKYGGCHERCEYQQQRDDKTGFHDLAALAPCDFYFGIGAGFVALNRWINPRKNSDGDGADNGDEQR